MVLATVSSTHRSLLRIEWTSTPSSLIRRPSGKLASTDAQAFVGRLGDHDGLFDGDALGIKVGAVVIKQAAGFVNRGGDLFNPALKYATR